MRDLWRTAIERRSFSLIDKAEETFRSFSASGRVLFMFFSGLLIASTAGLLYTLNSELLVDVPAYGGTVSEGIVGAPRFINPILAISDADHDLTSLVYSGLLRVSADGNYEPSLAQNYETSEDGRVYTFTLRPDATFHDGTSVTADDIIFTIQKTQDPVLKSPLRANWDGVTVTSPDPHTVQFTLKQAYAPFIENLTLGILPKHLWQDVSDEEFPFSDLNTSPIGSGPFEVASINRTSSGIPSSYILEAFSKYKPHRPYLNRITLRFYQSESDLVSALRSGEVENASSISPQALDQLRSFNVTRSSLNRVFGVFFNQNQSPVLRDADVRKALSDAVDRQALVKQVLGGYGRALTGPVPPGILGSENAPTSTDAQGSLVDAARAALEKAGWKMGPEGVLQKASGSGNSASATNLTFSLSTGNVPELRAAAEYLRATWGALGAKVEVHIYDQGDLSQNVIRPRKYDALLFGEVIGREIDLFAFWHSSQRADPGLNIALYTNSVADRYLEQLRQTTSDTMREQLYDLFNAQLERDIPAVFLYAPDFVYIVPKDLEGIDLGFIETPSDRFLSVSQWHRQSDAVWPMFAK